MSFGERLQAIRHSAGMTQEEFAQQLKVSRQSVSRWESDKSYPEIEKILYICTHYDVTPDELFRDELPSSRSSRAQDNRPPRKMPPLKSTPLKKSFGDFFANLSPGNQLLCLAGAAAAVLLFVVLLCASIMKGESDQMVFKLIWLGLLILFAVGEAISVGLTSIWFSAGSLAALVCAMAGGPEWLQVVLFLLVSGLCLMAVRPLAKKYLSPSYQPTNADRVIGTEAVVTEEINNLRAQGAVSVSGTVWSARSAEDTVIPAGTIVRVERIEGVKVFVTEVKEEMLCRS